eukprot:TRINITY_DN57005_c0_g1_i1.p1 TRINITY_DN57005_c0_g1~~TRINITY_DN57005_c0_g1_i1.p1  ORF type:complete len:441 (-),score=41.32 TRINITY_DN57005_c0_g1_i1:46-1311(-)
MASRRILEVVQLATSASTASAGVLDTTTILDRAVSAVAQTLTMISIGIFANKLKFIDSTSRRALSVISTNITIPCLLFSNLLTCTLGGCDQDPVNCKELWDSLSSCWPFLLLPTLWAGIGVGIGIVAARVSETPPELRTVFIAACSLPNSTGLPITLVQALSAAPFASKVSETTELRHFMVLLSIYGVTYPVIQWTLGGWLLAKQKDQFETEMVELGRPQPQSRATVSLQHVIDFVRAALVPPVIAVLVGLMFVFTAGVRRAFVASNSSSLSSPFVWLYRAAETFGKAAVPLNMLILGSSLAEVPAFQWDHYRSTFAAVFAKQVLHPAAAFLLICIFWKSGWLVAVVNVKLRIQFIVCACLLAATPTANNVVIMAEVGGVSQEAKRSLASLMLAMYCVAPFFLTFWIYASMLLATMTMQQQ